MSLAGLSVKAQLPEDVIRMSYNTPSGTARNQALGGALGSLGGDITSLYVNPAGLGFFKTGEFVISP
ncbi:MAG: aromatic hydrocarbon degradation protein, partial [Flavitalea sp.]